MTQQDGTVQAMEKAFRPSLWGSHEETDQIKKEKKAKMRIYKQRVRAGLPLFEGRRN